MGFRGMNLFLYLCFYCVVPIMYVTSRNEWKAKKNIVLGVTLPKEGRESEEVAEIGKKYRKELDLFFLLLTVTSLPAVFIRYMSISLTWDLIWMILAIIAPSVVYIRGWKRLRQLKKEKGWEPEQKCQITVDLSAIQTESRQCSLWWFLPPVVMGLIPCILTFVNLKGTESLWWAESIYLSIFVFTILLFIWMYRMIDRQRAEVVDERTDLTVALTRVRRRNWQKMALWSSWLTGVFSLAMYFLIDQVSWLLLATVVYSIILLVLAMNTEFTVRRVQERLTQDSGVTGYEDEDEYWLLGSFYYNPNDRHVWKNMRTGMNMTVNLATGLGKALTVFIVLLILLMPFMGIWTIAEEFTPVRYEVTDEQLVVSHLKKEYVIDLEDISEVQIIDELPGTRKDIGTNMDTIYKGQFQVEGYGTCHLCLNPEAEEFVVVEAGGKTYIFSPGEEVLGKIVENEN